MKAIYNNQSALSQPIFNQICGQILSEAMEQAEVLVIGAGGLGCELLKGLALSGIKIIHVIDLDVIDLTNLNRQFLFRMKDVGQFKAEVAANFIMQRIPSCKVIPYTKKIQEFPISFYEKFPVIIAGLDNVEARRWINNVVVKLTKKDENNQVIPESKHYLIDGGSEGLNGQSRVISPYESACYECTLNQLPKQVQYQMCTIASTPRLPEHCIAYAYEVLWPKDKKLDKDSYEDMNWIYQKALERAQQYNIQGVTYKLTMGVVKNIIPAVASTNAIIAAHCVNECIKILSGNGQILNNYFTWVGQAEGSGISSNIIQQERLDNCMVCQDDKQIDIIVNENDLLRSLLDKLPKDCQLQNHKNEILITSVVQLQEHYQKYLDMSIEQLVNANLIDWNSKLICLDGMNYLYIKLIKGI